jgi:hypothetical protein
MARMVSEDFIGTCQWCFGEYKVNGSRNVCFTATPVPAMATPLVIAPATTRAVRV